MPNTFELIASSTVGAGGASYVEFTSIPATFTDLCVKLSARSTGTGDWTTYVDMVINNDTSANYDQRNVGAFFNSTLNNQSWSNQNSFYVYQIVTASGTTSTFSNTELYIPNYTSTSNKSISVDGTAESNTSSQANRVMALSAGLYHPTSNTAISSLKFTASGGNFAQHSTFYIYGVKNA